MELDDHQQRAATRGGEADVTGEHEQDDSSADRPERPERPAGRPYTIGSFALALVAFLLTPVLAAPIGLFVGWLGWKRDDPMARWAMVANAVIIVLVASLVVAANV